MKIYLEGNPEYEKLKDKRDIRIKIDNPNDMDIDFESV